MLRRFILLSSLVCSLISTPGTAAVTPLWSTGAAVPGEKVCLFLVDDSGEFLVTARPEVQHARLEVQQPQAGADPMDPNRKQVEVYPFIITPDQPGELKVGDIEVQYKSGKRETVSIPPLTVVPTSQIQWQTTPVPFGVLWHTDLTDGYVDQPVNTALKVFLPADLEAPLAPELTSVGVRVGPVQPAVQGVAALVQSALLTSPTAYAKGQRWRTVDFRSQLTPFREGNSDVGGKLVLVQRQNFFSAARAEAELPILSIGALPLPPGAPANFAHTVGTYSISAETKAESLSMNEAVEVEITVRGSGNLEQMECPKPEDADDWKLVPATRKPLLDSNGDTVGMVFSQLMRPIAEVSGIPSFSFSYFDPKTMEYRQAATAPIALNWVKSSVAGNGTHSVGPAVEPPPAGEVPVEKMTDIYGYLTPAEVGHTLTLPSWLWYLLYLPAAAILAAVGISSLRRRIAAGAAGRAQERELAKLNAEPDALQFLKSIGAYIESHIPETSLTPDLRSILDRRDDEAFRPDAATGLSAEERHRMMKQLRAALAKLGVMLLAALALMGTTQAADEAQKSYEAGQYSHALQWLEQSHPARGEEALNLYNRGNCEYRLGNPGKAALDYARALVADPGLKEAAANLAFIQRKEGANVLLPLPQDEVFTYLTPAQLRNATIAATALLALGIALLIARRSHSKPWLHTFTAFAALLCLLCAADWLYYGTRETENLTALPPSNLAYITTTTDARTAADAQSSVLVNLKASTPVHLLAKRGDWCYIESVAHGTRGWVQAADVTPLLEGASPQTPLIIRF